MVMNRLPVTLLIAALYIIDLAPLGLFGSEPYWMISAASTEKVDESHIDLGLYGEMKVEALLDEDEDDSVSSIVPTADEVQLWNTWSSKMEFANALNKENEIDKEQNGNEKDILEIRKKIFIKQSRKLSKLKEKQSSSLNETTFTIGLNSFSAMTKKERKRLTGLIPVREQDKSGDDAGDNNNSGNEIKIGSKMYNSVNIPKSIDWRSLGAVSDVKMQGLCGACWAFAVIGMLEGLYFKKYGYLITFSEQELIDCDRDNNMGCNGGNFYYSLNDYYGKRQLGISTVKNLPYAEYQTVKAASTSTCPNVIKQTAAMKASTKIKFGAQSEQALIEAISRGPVAIAISGYSDVFQFYSGGVLNSADCGSTVDHAVLAVGYTEEYFIIKNSWSSQWGENGYARIKRGPGPNGLGYCGIYTQINELEYDASSLPIICNPSLTSVNSTDPCKPLKSSTFCTTQFGCKSESFYGDIGVVTPKTNSHEGNGTQSPAGSANRDPLKDNNVVLSIVIVVSVSGTVLVLISMFGIAFYLRKKREKEMKMIEKSESRITRDQTIGSLRAKPSSPTISDLNDVASSTIPTSQSGSGNVHINIPEWGNFNKGAEISNHVSINRQDSKDDDSNKFYDIGGHTGARRRRSSSILPSTTLEIQQQQHDESHSHIQQLSRDRDLSNNL